MAPTNRGRQAGAAPAARDVEPGDEDGRRLRRGRNRTAVLEALQELVLEGDPKPSAEAIAERAGVSLRSLYRYFPDHSSMMGAALDHNFERAAATMPTLEVGVGTFEERVERLAESRLALYEALAPSVRIARTASVSNEVIRARFDLGRELLRAQVEEQFAQELGRLSPPDRSATAAAADVLCQLETLFYLRVERGDEPAVVVRTMQTALRALFIGAAGA